ncbi:hypothetical protein [Micromonospora inyonensis]|uniref:Uncharacterized protein n=1 Tax=Micromonospora inyonensis TaxID=47866 RepID=A0A1C6RWR3_9ACTN|nr:hypothetical protein [Micromonospora inyonensis]SCL21648.1 hypothetical protein GA0074694_3100 [Micromonospora inyonensis]
MPTDHVHPDAQAAIDAVLTASPDAIQPRDPNRPEPHWRDITGADTADAAPYDAGDAPTAIVRPLPTLDDYLASDARLTPDTLRKHLATMYRVRDRQAAEIEQLTAERDQARATIASQAEQLRRNGTLLCRLRDLDEQRDRAWAEHDTLGRSDDLTTDDVDALAQAIEKADSVRIDARDLIWRPAPDGGWQHPTYGVISEHALDALGPNRAVLLVDIDADDSDMGSPPANWRLNPNEDQGAALGSPPARAQDPADITDPLTAALDTWAQHWRHRRQHGATPAQPADVALLAAHDAHRHRTTDHEATP